MSGWVSRPRVTLDALPPYPPGVFRWFLRWFEQLRARAGRRSRQIQDGAGKGQRKLMAEARLLGAEVQQLGATVWEHIDAVPFAPKRTRFSPVRTQFYGHGAFMGAAPAMLANPRWRLPLQWARTSVGVKVDRFSQLLVLRVSIVFLA